MAARAFVRPLFASVFGILLYQLAFCAAMSSATRLLLLVLVGLVLIYALLFSGGEWGGRTVVRGAYYAPLPSPSGAGKGAPLRHTYVPSPFEADYVSHIFEYQTQLCQLTVGKHYDHFQLLIALIEEQELLRARGPPADASYVAAMHAAKPLLSRLEYRNAEGTLVQTVYLEPLAGMLRDPRPVCWDVANVGKLPKDVREFVPPTRYGLAKYTLLAPPLPGAPKNILLDIGGSKWSDLYGLRWLVESYAAQVSWSPQKMLQLERGAFSPLPSPPHSQGVFFEHIYSWEMLPLTPQYWEGMPLDVARRVHFYNKPCSARPGDVSNPWETVRIAATEADFVVVKLDIDFPSIELPLVQQLLNEVDVRSKVDEFYFEHHVDADILSMWWAEDGTSGSMKDSYDIFRRMREAGIRAHSWP